MTAPMEPGPWVFVDHVNFRKSVVSIKFPPVILGPEMAAPIYVRLAFFRSFCWKTPMPIKFFLLGGFWGFLEGGGGGSANFIFMDVGIFPTISTGCELLGGLAAVGTGWHSAFVAFSWLFRWLQHRNRTKASP